MARRHDNLFGQIANFEALSIAARKAMRGKRRKSGASMFQFQLEKELLRLEQELKDGTYCTGCYVEIQLKDPKKRLVSAAPFRDRVVQHALMNVVAPIFDTGFIHNSFANRVGKGTHRAIACYERYRNRYAFVLRCDIFRFFPAIDHQILKRDFRRRIKCAQTLALMDVIVDGSNAQEPVDIHFPGDDLLTPMERRRGLPIGNLMSQFSANLYMNPLDHFATEVLRAPYLRYVDDFALFHDDLTVLEHWRSEIESFLVGRRLKLHPRKTHITDTEAASQFLGFTLHGNGKRSLPDESIGRFKRRMRSLRDKISVGSISVEDAQIRVDAWIAHSEHGHARGLNRALLGKKGQPFYARP